MKEGKRRERDRRMSDRYPAYKYKAIYMVIDDWNIDPREHESAT